MPLRMLIVDDSPLIRRLLRAAARDVGGFEIFEAEDGAQGMLMFQQVAPHLVVTDFEMPIMDGLMMVRALRKMQGGERTIIAMLTSHDDAQVVALQAGADTCLQKPLTLDVIRERLRGWLIPQDQRPLPA